MKKYFGILRKCSLFNKVEEDNLLSLLSCLGATVKTYQGKETIISEGTVAKYIGIVLSGSARIIQVDYFGNRSILSAVEPGEVFGESFACAGIEAIPISVVANETSEIMLIDCNRVINSCTNACHFHRQIVMNLMHDIAYKNIKFHQKIEITSKRTTREKLMAYLMYQAKNVNSNSFEIAFDRQELADYLQVDRSGLSAEISKMRKEGILESRKNHFKLL